MIGIFDECSRDELVTQLCRKVSRNTVLAKSFAARGAANNICRRSVFGEPTIGTAAA